MRLHKIQVEKISSLQISMLSITLENYLLYIKFSQFDKFSEVIIPAYCICHSLDKHNF